MFGIDLSLELINTVVIAAGVVLLLSNMAAASAPQGAVIDFDRADTALR